MTDPDLPEWEQRIRREHEMDKEPEPPKPEDKWASRGELKFGFAVSVILLLLSLYTTYDNFLWWKPLTIVLFSFMAGVGAAPLWHKIWFEKD